LAYSSQNGFQTLMTCSAVGGTAAWRRVKIFTIDYGNDVHRFVVDVSSGESGPFSVELVEDTSITADLPIAFGQTVSITGQGSVAESVALQTGKDICPGTGDLRSFASDSTTECSQACYDDARCAAFVLRVDGSLCYLKSCSLLVVDDPNAVLGVIRASTRWGSGGFTVQQSASLIWTNLAVEGDAAVHAGGTLEVFSSTVSSHISVVGGSFTGQDSTFISNVDVAAGGTASLTRCTLGTDAFGDTAGALITVTGGSSLSITSVVMPVDVIPRLTDTGSTLQLDDVAFPEVPDSLTHRLAGTVTVEADGSMTPEPPNFLDLLRGAETAVYDFSEITSIAEFEAYQAETGFVSNVDTVQSRGMWKGYADGYIRFSAPPLAVSVTVAATNTDSGSQVWIKLGDTTLATLNAGESTTVTFAVTNGEVVEVGEDYGTIGNDLRVVFTYM
jgi:hypothetical protein